MTVGLGKAGSRARGSIRRLEVVLAATKTANHADRISKSQ